MSWSRPIPPFVAHPLIRGGHLQTIAAAYLWRRRPYGARQHQILLGDDDRLVVHDDRPEQWRSGDDVAVLVHGLAGCHGSGYMNRIADKLRSCGVRVFRLDMRGCGAGWKLARWSLHADRTEDLQRTIRFVRQLAPKSRVAVAGFSLGASILLKLLGQLGADGPSLIDRAISVAAPLDLSACSVNLGQGWNRMYDRTFVRNLLRDVRRRRRHVVGLRDTDGCRRPRSLYEFDAMFTAPLGGFANVDDYYRRSSSFDELDQIAVPTWVLFSEDDPLIPTDVYRLASFSSSTQVFATQAGGHLGYLAAGSASSDADWHWMDWRVVDWITQEGPIDVA